jgi:Na+-transporting NADH:ubiquinone oxidoreductase subunit F
MAQFQGEHTITVNGNVTFPAKADSSLFASLRGAGIPIPTVCGGRGRCGRCRVKVPSGGGSLTDAERRHLSKEEIAQDARLSCQVRIREDVSVDLPEELFRVRHYRGRCEQIRSLTHDIKLVRIGLLEPDSMDFTAGQYIQLEAPAYGDNPEPVYRTFSMASPPGVRNAVELIIRLMPHGVCTTWVHNILAEGDEAAFSGPYGDFHLRDTDRDVILIAGGSGLSPMRSILKDMADKKNDRRTVLYFGALAKRDVYLTEELDELREALPNFDYTVALSAPDETDEWNGERGLITEVLERREPDASEKEVYACGSPGMIDACIGTLTGMGVPEERIYFDKFA